MKTLADEVYSIMSDAMKEILKRTEGHKSARDYLLDNICRCCVIAFTNTDYKKKNEKIAYFKKWTDYYINDIDKAIEDFRHCEDNQQR